MYSLLYVSRFVPRDSNSSEHLRRNYKEACNVSGVRAIISYSQRGAKLLVRAKFLVRALVSYSQLVASLLVSVRTFVVLYFFAVYLGKIYGGDAEGQEVD